MLTNLKCLLKTFRTIKAVAILQDNNSGGIISLNISLISINTLVFKVSDHDDDRVFSEGENDPATDSEGDLISDLDGELGSELGETEWQHESGSSFKPHDDSDETCGDGYLQFAGKSTDNNDIYDMLEKSCIDLEGIRCAAHTFQLAVLDALKTGTFNALILKARKVMKKLKTKNVMIMLKRLKLKHPKLDCPTR
jgi:hypothetical protein